jgi:aerobic-type carbon monoxide dehydrogenase small subunit (CoxS/CutS family)
VRKIDVEFTVNGEKTALSSYPNRTLLDVLRDDLGLTGAKDACGGEGECGACTVILNGKPVNSCLVFIGQVEGSQVTTIEGINPEGGYHPLQKAFVEAGAVQCGYCTPGAILAAKALLDRNPQPSDQEIREGLSGNLCRCTGYTKMLDAVHQVMEEGLND